MLVDALLVAKLYKRSSVRVYEEMERVYGGKGPLLS